MSTNTPIQKFKSKQTVTCPACGASVGIKDPASFVLQFDNRARSYLNGLLVDLRNFTRGMDAFLAGRLTELTLHDIGGSPYAREELLFLIDEGLITEATRKDVQLVAPDGKLSKDVLDRLERGTVAEIMFERIRSKQTAKKIGDMLSPYGEFLRIDKGDTNGRVAAQVWSDFFQLEIDTHDFIVNFQDLDGRLPDPSNASTELVERLARGLLGIGLERRSNGLLMELVREQTHVREFLQADGLKRHAKLIRKIVGKIRPALALHYEFLERCVELRTTKSIADSPPNALSVPQDDFHKIRDNLERAWFVLLVLHGHAYQNLPTEVQSELESHEEFGQDFKSLFLTEMHTFREGTTVSEGTLTRLLNSRTLLQDRNSVLTDILPTWFKKLFDFVRPNAAVESWLREFDKIVRVHCNNEVATHVTLVTEAEPTPKGKGWKSFLVKFMPQWKKKPPERYKLAEHGQPKVRYLRCNYQLTDQQTFNVVILGSMGSGKTCAFETALARLWKLSEALGIDLCPIDADSLFKMESMRDDVKKGRVKDPTDINFAVNWDASLIGKDSNHRLRLSVLDVPGETVYSLISGDGSDSELRRILRHANAIVFLYDMWCDDAFLSDVSSAGSTFEKATKLADDVEKVREQRQGTRVDQRVLLSRLCDMLASERGSEKLRQLPFLCVFPKADLLVSESAEQQKYILSRLMDELRRAGILVRGHSFDKESPESFANYQSAGCVGIDWNNKHLVELFAKYKIPPAGHNVSEHISHQIRFCQLLSEMTREAFRNMAEMLDGDPPPAVRKTFSSRIQDGVVQFIRERFDQCYFLPVSALGRSPVFAAAGNERKPQALGELPNSLLVEYTFLLPLLLAFKDAFPSTDDVAIGKRK
ncbi:MAG: hypothetical protein JNM43_28310 [Planctomycetaceae bacterium]|nr:hypothetical protein [Planctomycetaceae bacterium]